MFRLFFSFLFFSFITYVQYGFHHFKFTQFQPLTGRLISLRNGLMLCFC